jgi:hypothetical protein
MPSACARCWPSAPGGHIEIPDDDLGDRRLGDKRFLGQVPHMCDGRMQAEKSDLADKEAVPA